MKENSKNPSTKRGSDSKVDKSNKNEYSSQEEFDDLDGDIDVKLDDAIGRLKQKLKECQQERKEFLDGWQRSKAELINARKQDIKQNKQIISRFREDFVYQLLPVLDSFEMAFSDAEALEKVDRNWSKGVQNIYSQLQTFLTDLGVHTIDQMNVPFDPKKHDCIETTPTTTKEQDGLIVEVFQKGYMLSDTTIRAARVRVFKIEAH